MSKPTGKKVLINVDPTGVQTDFTLEATVASLLSVQFTARWKAGALSYLFYSDEGATWINK